MTSKGLEMLEILKQRNGNLKINHKIGSRDIANQEIKEITQCFDNYVIPVIEKDLERLEKLEKVIDFLKLNFDISLDSKLRISDGSECVQTFITYLPENTTIDEMFKVLKEVFENDK